MVKRNLEELIIKYKLTDIQINELYKTFYIYDEVGKDIKKEGYFIDKYKTFTPEYFINEIKKGKISKDIVLNIIGISELYERRQIIQYYLDKYEKN